MNQLPCLGRNRILLAILVLFSLPCGLPAAEAVLADGQILQGKLRWENGRLWFAASRSASRRLDQVVQVRFPAAPVTPFRGARLFRLALPDGQRLTGEILDLDVRNLHFRTTWGQIFVIPRAAAASLSQRPGWLTFFDDDFESELKGWKLTGSPSPSDKAHFSGKKSLLLQSPGQAAEHALAAPLAAGRVEVNFRDSLDVSGCRFLVELDFQGQTGPRVVRAEVAGEAETYRVEAPGMEQKPFPLRRSPGWHRLHCEFGPQLLLIAVDDDLLWVDKMQGAGGSLRKVRLTCLPLANQARPRGEVFFDDFSLARPVEPLRHHRADPDQDELWLASGDQLLGNVARANARAITLAGRFGTRPWDWGEVRGLFFRQEPAAIQETDGETVTVVLRTGAGPEVDRVTGVVRDVDAKHLALRHPVLGIVDIERSRLRRLEWIFHGGRLQLDGGPHHLGPRGRLVAGLRPARAEGIRLAWSFRLDAVPPQARLQVGVVHLKGPGDGIAAELKRGELRTEVVVNGVVIDYLNRHVQRSSREVQRLRVDLPARLLKAGVNSLELRLTPEQTTRHYESCGLMGLALEMPR